MDDSLRPPLVAWAILAYNWQTAFVITMSGAARCADFDYFEYRERAYLERPL